MRTKNCWYKKCCNNKWQHRHSCLFDSLINHAASI